jgi:methyl-accepting chemotaxis protein
MQKDRVMKMSKSKSGRRAALIFLYLTAIVSISAISGIFIANFSLGRMESALKLRATQVTADGRAANLEGMESAIKNEVEKARKETVTGMTLVAVMALLLAGVLGLAAVRHYNRWLDMFAGALKRGANGDLSVKVGTSSGDELGKLGADFDTMTDKLAGMIGNINKSTGELIRVSGNLSNSSKQLLNAAQRQTDGVSDTSSAMVQINASIKGVAHGIDSLSLSAAESSSSIMEMAASIEEVALNVETLTQSVQEVSSSIVEMATSVKQIDSNVASLTDEFTTTAS